MNTKHILITGGHSGIGYELTRMLLREENTHIGLVIRSKERQSGLPAELLDAANIDFFYADLSEQASILALAQDVKTRWQRLDVLFNNAGVLLDDFYTSKQGNEMHLEVNTLAPYKLTLELLPLLDQSGNPVIVNTVTGGLNNKKSLNLKAFTSETPFRKLFGAYLESKFSLTLLSEDLARTHPKIRILNVDPGPNKTKMTTGSAMPKWLVPIRNLLFPKPTKGASLLFKAAFDEKHKQEKSAYLRSNKKTNLKYHLSESDKASLLSGFA